MCHHCDDAGCSGDRECQAADAYGGEPEEGDAQPEARPQPEPRGEIERLLADAPAARATVEALRATIPDAALTDSRHPYWDSPAAAEVLGAMIDAIDGAAERR